MQFPRSTLESLNKEYFSRISLRSWLFRKWLGAPVLPLYRLVGLIRLFSKVVKKQILTPFFVFCFLILSEDPFLRGSKNKNGSKKFF